MNTAERLAIPGARLSDRRWTGYVAAVAGTALAAWLRWELAGALGPELPPFITFYPVIILSALLGGTASGLLATALSALLVDYLFLPPVGTLWIRRPVDMAGIALFTAVNIMMSLAGGALRKARQRTQRQARDLAHTVDLLDLVRILLLDSDFRIIHWNTGCQQLYGFTPEQALGSVSHTLLRTRFPEPLENIRSKLLVTGLWQGELIQTASDGRTLTIASRWLLRRESGAPPTILEINADITALKAAEDSLHRSEQRFQALVTATSEALFRMSPDWSEMRELLMGSLANKGFQANAEQPSRTWLQEHIPPEDQPRVNAAIQQAIRTKDILELEHRVRRADGGIGWIFSRAVPLLDPKGEIEEWFGASADITDRKHTEEALQQARDELARTNAGLEQKVQQRTAKLQEALADLEHMSYSMVHDMRAPLRAMQAFSTFAEEECAACSSPESKNFFHRIRESAKRLDRLVTDALNYNKVIREQLPTTPVDLAKLLRGMIDSYPDLQPSVAEIQLDFHELFVLGNESFLTQVFGSLLGNAVKFVAPGVRPRIRLWAEPSTLNSQPSTTIYIQDNGLGIPKEAHAKIFLMFQRMHRENQYPGTGIGLAIVRKAAERMGGQVGLESEPGVGSRFWVQLSTPAPDTFKSSNSSRQHEFHCA